MKKIAIITGASGGLGKEFIRLLLNDVDETWAVGRNISKLENLKEELESLEHKIVPLQMDLSKIESLELLFEKLKAEVDIKICYLVNNAGYGRFGQSKDFPTKELAENITTHCTAIAAISNICIPFMSKGCHIVNVASQAAFLPLPYMNLYAATKAFVYSYTRSLKSELKSSGIKVTAVCPGWIKTNLLPETLNGKKVTYPFIAKAENVAKKAIKDAKKGKALSSYKFFVRAFIWQQRHMNTSLAIKIWTLLIRKFVKNN